MPTFFEAFRSNNNEKLINAAKEGKVDIVNNLLDDKKRKVDINFQDKYGATALMYASEFGHSNVAKQLLEAGAKKDLADKDGITALMRASQYGHSFDVSQLLKAGANPDLADKDGKTALMHASGHDQSNVVLQLLDAGANFDHQDQNGKTALMYASLYIAEQLLEAGANPDLADIKGLTALMGASACGYFNVATELLEKGANVDQADKDFRTALILASANGNLDIVKQLLEKGANVDLADKDGKTALMHGSSPDIVEQLLEAGANKDLADKYGRTALMYASECGHPDVITQSLEKEAGNTAETSRYAGAQRDLTSAKKVANKISKGVISAQKALGRVLPSAFRVSVQQRSREDIRSPLLGSATSREAAINEGGEAFRANTAQNPLEVNSTLTTSSKEASPAASPAASGNSESLVGKPRTR